MELRRLLLRFKQRKEIQRRDASSITANKIVRGAAAAAATATTAAAAATQHTRSSKKAARVATATTETL